MNIADRAQIGTTSLEVTRLGFGSAPIGGLYDAVDAEAAIETVDAAWATGVRLFDTAPLYGMGEAEKRVGSALRRRSRRDFVLATKVGRLLRATDQPDPTQIKEGKSNWKGVPALNPVYDFSYDGALRSFEESLERLALDSVDIVHIHDPDEQFDAAMEGAYRALVRLRDEGVVKAIGAGMNQWEMLSRFADEGDFDCFLRQAGTACSTVQRSSGSYRAVTSEASQSSSAVCSTAESSRIRTHLTPGTTTAVPVRTFSSGRAESTPCVQRTACR